MDNLSGTPKRPSYITIKRKLFGTKEDSLQPDLQNSFLGVVAQSTLINNEIPALQSSVTKGYPESVFSASNTELVLANIKSEPVSPASYSVRSDESETSEPETLPDHNIMIFEDSAYPAHDHQIISWPLNFFCTQMQSTVPIPYPDSNKNSSDMQIPLADIKTEPVSPESCHSGISDEFEPSESVYLLDQNNLIPEPDIFEYLPEYQHSIHDDYQLLNNFFRTPSKYKSIRVRTDLY